MDDGSRRRRRTQTQPYEASTSSQSSPRPGRSVAMQNDQEEASYLSPSGRPMRQRSSVNLRNVSPPSLAPTRPQRASSSRAARGRGNDSASSPVEGEASEEEYVEEEEQEEQEVIPSRSSKRSAMRAKQQPQEPPPPAPPLPAPASALSSQPQHASSSSPFKVTLGGRGRVAHRGAKRARLAEELDAGWMPEADDEEDGQMVYSTIVAKLQSWLSTHAVPRLADFFESVPSGTKFEKPMTLRLIGERVGRSEYGSSIDFEKDMLQLFYNGRRYFEPGSDAYGGVLTLQRMYNHMTQSTETAKEDIDDHSIARNFASIQYGPCEDQGSGPGEASSEGERLRVPFVRYKGQVIFAGNFVHLSNPTDPSRPIIAQVFKTRTEDLGDGKQDWITVCWFLRPEQTKHPRSMLFWPGEALKTSQFVEHHVEDVIEMISVMYYTKYLKGRPAEGEGGWREGDPLYVCENRFHAEKEQFYKIKNWFGVMPEEARNRNFEMVEFDQPMAPPPKVKSPFLLGSNGPGGIAEESYRPYVAAPSLIRSNSSFMGGGSGLASPLGTSGGLERASGLGSMPRPVSRINGPAATHAAPISTTTANTTTSSTSKIPQLFKEWSDEVQAQRRAYLKAKEDKASVGAATPAAPATDAKDSNVPPGVDALPPIAQAVDRSVSSAMIQMDVPAYYKTLPNKTQQLFHQDAESGSLLWYPAPPFVPASEARTQRQWNHGDKLPTPSLDYLYHMATQGSQSKKRKSAPTPTSRHAHRAGALVSLALDEGEGVDVSKAFSTSLKRTAAKLSRVVVLDDAPS